MNWGKFFDIILAVSATLIIFPAAVLAFVIFVKHIISAIS